MGSHEPPTMTQFNEYKEPPQKVKDEFARHLQDSRAQSEYDKGRERLLESEQQVAWDKHAKDSASSNEVSAGLVLHSIREDEKVKLFGNVPGEDIPGDETLDMGGQFLTNRERIELHSTLYKIIRTMPKGFQLHIHFNAQLYPEKLLEQAKHMVEDTMFIRCNRPLLTMEDCRNPRTEILLEVKPSDTQSSDIFSQEYRTPTGEKWNGPNGKVMKLDLFCKRFEEVLNSSGDHNLSGEQWILDRTVIQPDDVYRQSQTLNGIWAKFNQSTRCFKGLLSYESIFKWYVSAAIKDMVRDRIMYAEMRPMLMDKSIASDDGKRRLFHEAQMRFIQEEVDKTKAELKAQGRLDDFPFGIKIIYCAPRSIPKPRMCKEMEDCIKLKIDYPDLICGFDLVGAEDRPNCLSYYRDELLAFRATCDSLGIDIPFMFHAGETLLDTGGSSDPRKSNLYDCALLGAKRVGHGFSILKHPLLIESFKEQGICIEMCPISNELLHLCRNIKQHPFPQLLQAGLHCTLNSDNPSLFRSPNHATSSSLSYEFYQVMVGDPRMSIHGWRQMIEWSIEHSSLSAEEKARAMKIFRREWEDWCASVVATYGEQYGVTDRPAS